MFKNWIAIRFSPHRVVSCSGSRYKTVYAPKVLKDGTIELVEKEKVCLYDYIQSFKDSCDINTLVRRYAQGDTAALLSGSPFFGDVTEMPSNFAEMLQVSLDAEAFFNKLPSDERQKFDNNFSKFLASFGSDEFLSALGVKKESEQAPAAPVESEVKSDE